MEMITFNVQLAVEIKEGKLIAELAFTNNTGHEMTLDKYTICVDGKFRNKVFVVTSSNGQEISYKGPMYKRQITSEDSLKLQAGELVRTNVILNDAYDLEVGKKYTIQYSAKNHGACINSVRVYMQMKSNPVKILYR